MNMIFNTYSFLSRKISDEKHAVFLNSIFYVMSGSEILVLFTGIS